MSAMNNRLRQVVRPATEDGDRDDQSRELLVPAIPDRKFRSGMA
jgi:hypothetical protein